MSMLNDTVRRGQEAYLSHTLEQLIDILHDTTLPRTRHEQHILCDKIIKYETEYKQLFGHYYNANNRPIKK